MKVELIFMAMKQKIFVSLFLQNLEKKMGTKHLYRQRIVHPVTQNRATLTDRKEKSLRSKSRDISCSPDPAFQQPILKQRI